MPRPPSAVASEHARYAFFLFGAPTLFSAGRFPFLLESHCAVLPCQRACTRKRIAQGG